MVVFAIPTYLWYKDLNRARAHALALSAPGKRLSAERPAAIPLPVGVGYFRRKEA